MERIVRSLRYILRRLGRRNGHAGRVHDRVKELAGNAPIYGVPRLDVRPWPIQELTGRDLKAWLGQGRNTHWKVIEGKRSQWDDGDPGDSIA